MTQFPMSSSIDCKTEVTSSNHLSHFLCVDMSKKEKKKREIWHNSQLRPSLFLCVDMSKKIKKKKKAKYDIIVPLGPSTK